MARRSRSRWLGGRADEEKEAEEEEREEKVERSTGRAEQGQQQVRLWGAGCGGGQLLSGGLRTPPFGSLLRAPGAWTRSKVR